MSEQTIRITEENDVVAARQAGRDAARALGFGSAEQTRLATAIAELTRNVIRYAGCGVCSVKSEPAAGEGRVDVVVEDSGPGIPDVRKAMEEGYSTSNGLGAGLPAARRLVHDFHIESRPGCTRITVALVRGKKESARGQADDAFIRGPQFVCDP